MLGWLTGGNDRQTAATSYAGCESATDRATRKAGEKRAKTELKDNKRRARTVAAADRAGRATYDVAERRRFGRR